ncbi:MAG: aminopeptidase P family protein [Actinobacteria bacterium]|nr:aminopeptidase P family protein [Actinomycetota bacterium]MCL6087910.1 aminopeptidase P family protein [Actinomycetota bacterium]
MQKDEFLNKKQRLLKSIENKNIGAVLISKQSNFLWITCGKRNDVLKNYNNSLVYLLITKEEDYLIATNSDGNRVIQEELLNLNFNKIIYKWDCEDVFDAIKKLGIQKKIGGDFNDHRITNIEDLLINLRVNLTYHEIGRTIQFCKRYTKILTEFCLELKPEIKECEIAASLNYRLLMDNIKATVLMIGSDDRIFKFRHPVATNKIVNKYLLISTVVEEDGINISVSRSVYFGKAPKNLHRKQYLVNFIDATYYNYSISGRNLTELYIKGKETYSKMNLLYEWEKHTQGGIIGYTPREIEIKENSNYTLNNNNLISFNPTIEGVKTEDVLLIEDDKPKQLTIDNNWPCEELNINKSIYLKPKILEI